MEVDGQSSRREEEGRRRKFYGRIEEFLRVAVFGDIDTVYKRIARIEAKKKPDDFDKDALKKFKEQTARYDELHEALGEAGRTAWALWFDLQGQRRERFSSLGEIDTNAYAFLFDLYEIDEQDRLDLYIKVKHIDALYRQKAKKKAPPPDSGKGGKKKR